MKYTFIKVHRPQFNVRIMCRMLRVHPSEFYAWLAEPTTRSSRSSFEPVHCAVACQTYVPNEEIKSFRKMCVVRQTSFF